MEPQKTAKVPDLNPDKAPLNPWTAQQYSSAFPESTGRHDC